MLLAGLSACASAPKSTSFSGSSGNALIVLATPVDGSNNLDVFRRVDLTSSKFVGQPVTFDVKTTYGMLDNMFAKSNQINAEVEDRTVALAIIEVEPGDYVRVEALRSAGSSAFGFYSRVCLNHASEIYSVSAGEIAVIRVDKQAISWRGGFDASWRPSSDSPSDQNVLEQLDRARPDYPAIVGTAVLKKPIALITWQETRGGFFSDRQCAKPGSFEQAAAGDAALARTIQ